MTINSKNFLNDKRKMSRMGEFQELKEIEGLEISSVTADLYGNGRDDLSLFFFKDGANYASLTTLNSIVSESLEWNKKSNKKSIKALMVNTKNANTFTGEQGFEGLNILAKNLAKCLTIKESKKNEGISETVKIKDIIFASTGVIGEEFPTEKINNSIQNLVDKLRENQNKLIWVKSASAIMTTDTKPKLAYEEFLVGNKIIKLAGIAKGSGMIAPNLATMLSFIFTNADIPSNILRTLLKKATANTFNAITVDSDQSTNDMVSIFSTKKIKVIHNRNITDPVIQKFEIALKKLCLNLAKQIVVDGEGAKKFVTVKILNARSLLSAKKIAFSIANSPLVKTAIAGEDANWGRVVMAIGKTQEKIDQEKIKIKFGNILLGNKTNNKINTSKVDKYMKNKIIEINICLGLGNASRVVYGNDLNNEYIRINADYRS